MNLKCVLFSNSVVYIIVQHGFLVCDLDHNTWDMYCVMVLMCK